MEKEKETSIEVDVKTREKLKKLKMIPQESYNQVIIRLMDTYKVSENPR